MSDIGELVELALEKGGNANSSDREGQTPLHHASKVNALEAAKILLTNNADINARDNKGYTPLHMAAIHRHPEIAKLLIDRGADVNAVNKEGHTPLYEAENFIWYPVSELTNEKLNQKLQQGQLNIEELTEAKTKLEQEAQPKGTQEIIKLLQGSGGTK